MDKNQIYELKVTAENSSYYYHGITTKILLSDGETYLVDVLINTNSEKQMLENFTKTLSIGTIIVIVLSIIISWYIAKRTVTPIVKSYKKQTEFVQNASHELRTPLTIIQANRNYYYSHLKVK